VSTQVIKRLLIIIFLVALLSSKSLSSSKKIEFWNIQRKGANGDGGKDPDKWFGAAAEVGIEFVRLIPVNWESQGRDFLLGDADNFRDIPAQDFQKLKETLDVAHRYNVKVLLTMFSLPGARNRQDNDYKFDYRLWTDQKYQQQALAFWKELAARLKNHPAIVGYNPLNEPHPARKDGFESDRDREGFADWLTRHKKGTSDLNRFNRLIVKAIRSEDTLTPIVLDGWFHSTPNGFRYLIPIDDDAVLYAFHFYEPWIFATYRVNKGRFSYPNSMPGDTSETTSRWTAAEIRQRLQPVVEWAQRYNIPAWRIMAEELGCDRRVSGAKEYLEDIVGVFNEAGWHWAFYSFRASDWDGLDYELGTQKLGWKYWQEREKGIDHEDLIKRHDNPLWDVFKREFTQKQKTGRLVEDISNPNVRKLVQALSSQEWRERQQAAVAIGEMGVVAKAAIPSLIDRLKDEEWHVRKAAAIALTCMGSEAKVAVNSLVAALEDEEWHVRKPAAEALAAIGPASWPAVPSLIRALSDEEWHVRKPAAEALAAIGPASKPAISHLIETLNDEEWQVRKPAALALGAIGPDARQAIPVLKEMLNDPEWQVRKAATDALEKIAR